jgi:putative glutamine amidotransferase
MPRPIVGLTTYAQQARFGSHDTPSAVLPLSYVQAVHASGGRAVLVTPDDPGEDVLDCLDAIIFTGGSDIDPAHYAAEPHAATSAQPERDRAELLLLRAALERDLPILGICRGFELMSVVAGGQLHQHLPELLGHDDHRPLSGPKYGQHAVRLVPGTLCQKILGDEVIVNSYHHQGVTDPGRLVAAGYCTGDDLLEAAEDPTRAFAVGVQWHPEEMTDRRIFVALVQAAERH